MSKFWKQNRFLISIVTAFVVLGVIPFAVMRSLSPEQSETALPDETLIADIAEETPSEDSVEEEEGIDKQRPFYRFLKPVQEEEKIEETTKENKDTENINPVVSAQSAPPLESIPEPEKEVEVPVKPDIATINPPVAPTDNIDTKKNDPSTPVKPEPPKPEPTKPEPAKPEPVKQLVKPEPPKPEPVKPKPVKIVTTKPEQNQTKPVKPEPNKMETTKTSPDLIPFLYFYQQSRSGNRTVILFPLTPESAPLVFETKSTPTLVPATPVMPVIPAIPMVPVIPILSVQPVYTLFIVPTIEY
jgi:hypothetical protein